MKRLRAGTIAAVFAGGLAMPTAAFAYPPGSASAAPPPPPVAPADRDHDGILNPVDACPDVRGVRTTEAKTNGCPLNPWGAPAGASDRDNNRIPDTLDACPDVAGVKTTETRTNGCPLNPWGAPAGASDRDNDRVPDSLDACPDTFGPKSDDPRTSGCPNNPWGAPAGASDRDKDRIPDSIDACPDTFGMKTDEKFTNGCPANPWGAPAGASDRDKDRVPDMLDACPDTVGVKTDDPKTTGCPAQAIATPVKKSIAPASIPLIAPTTAAPAPAASVTPDATNTLGPEPPRRRGGSRGLGSTSLPVKLWAIAIGVVVGIATAFLVRHRRAPSERTEAVVLHDLMVRDDLRVDLYLPTPGTPAPWIVLADEGARIAAAEALQRRGIGVAMVALTSTDGGTTRRVDERVADFVRELAHRTNAYGLVSRPVLVGNASGAALVARLALDPDLGLEAGTVAGVVTMNGDYASVIPRVRADAPPFLVLSAHGDSTERPQQARSFARALERAGAKSVRSYHVAARDEQALADFSGDRNDIADLVASFVRAEPAPGGAENAWTVADAWSAHAPLSTEPFWEDERLVVRRPIDDRFRAHLGRLFVDSTHDLEPWPCKTYDAIGLSEYLGAHPELGTGNWVVLTNARGEQLVLSRSEIQREKPAIVIGIDDERNLFRLLVTYNVYRTYTFKPETLPRSLLARPVGAFLHFPNASDTAPRVVTLADFALTRSSFRVVNEDPLASVRVLPKPLYGTLTGEQGCLQCHSLRGTGAQSHHIRAVDGKPTGGQALAFEEYPREVMQRFLFHQDEIAPMFGVAPIRVGDAAATQLLQELTRDAPAR